MNIQIITASAGTGKTTRLAQLLGEAVRDSTARPDAILATTFTKQAAAELLNRARIRLLKDGQGKAAQALLTARIGTVNAVCGSLVTDFSFELGLSPELRVLDEGGADLTLKRALALVVTDDVSNVLQSFRSKFDNKFDWHYELRRLIEAARANGLTAESLPGSADRSIASLDACLGPVTESADALDAELGSAIDGVLAAINGNGDVTATTRGYVAFLASSRRGLDRGQLRWGDWAKLAKEDPAKKSVPQVGPVQSVAVRHLGHPRLRADMHQLIRTMFDVAAQGLRQYQLMKKEQGLLDFVDQEVLALDLLSRPPIRDVLKDQLDLVLVDEFQDTSPLQLAIFLNLAGLARKCVWVGDPKQAIYGFRGTDPALMDAAIESLSSPLRDPDLISAAVDAVASQSPVQTLSISYRSRPPLVELTNAIFTRAFSAQQGMPEARVRVQPHRIESPDIGLAVSHWPLSNAGKAGGDVLPQAVAAGVRDLLKEKPSIWDDKTGYQRPATARDLAILCRTNAQCLGVSESLGQLGIASVVSRVGLLDSAEAQVLVAGLRFWVDPRDSLAAATLVRILEHPDDAAGFTDKMLAVDRTERLTSSTAITALLAARETAQNLDTLDVLDAAVDALELRRLCAAWGNATQRIANLDALRGHAARYCDQRQAGGDAPSLVGFLARLHDMAEDAGWGKSRGDTTARVGSGDAVTVSTWHAAKGLEWPIVILFGLETVRKPEAYGVHVLSDRSTFDVNNPLGGRWIHFWPNPYTTANQGGAVKDAYARSDAYQHVSRQGDREALRVLYVGWTRSRDQLILAAQRGKLLGGLLGTLNKIEPGLVGEPDATTNDVVGATWADHAFQIRVVPHQPATPSPMAPSAGDIRVGRPPTRYAPASIAPSSAAPRSATMGQPVHLGPPVRMRRHVEVDDLGTALHDFFAADDALRSVSQRLDIANGLLDRHLVTGALEPAQLLELADRLWGWLRDRFAGAAVIRTEWPLSLMLEAGTRVGGTSDLIAETDDHVAVIDHKSFGLTTAVAKAEGLKGQLACYADAVARARPGKIVSMWVHLPFEGVMVEVR